MQRPTELDKSMAKRVGRYLLGKKCLVLRMGEQEAPTFIEAVVDSDFAGCPLTRKSTSGKAIRHGSHVLSTSATLQSTVSLSSGEAEYYALLKGAADGLKMVAMAEDFGIKLGMEVSSKTDPPPLEIASDSTSALAFAQRRGLGRQKHVMTRYLWLQDAIHKRRVKVRKVATKLNIADPLTKAVSGQTMERHLRAMGYRWSTTWSSLHRKVKVKGKGDKMVQQSAGSSGD